MMSRFHIAWMAGKQRPHRLPCASPSLVLSEHRRHMTYTRGRFLAAPSAQHRNTSELVRPSGPPHDQWSTRDWIGSIDVDSLQPCAEPVTIDSGNDEVLSSWNEQTSDGSSIFVPGMSPSLGHLSKVRVMQQILAYLHTIPGQVPQILRPDFPLKMPSQHESTWEGTYSDPPVFENALLSLSKLMPTFKFDSVDVLSDLGALSNLLYVLRNLVCFSEPLASGNCMSRLRSQED